MSGVTGATDIATNANPPPRNPDTASSEENKFNAMIDSSTSSTISNDSSKQSQSTSNSFPMILATRPPINLAQSQADAAPTTAEKEPAATMTVPEYNEPPPARVAAETTGLVVACGTAAVELGANPIADIGCIADAIVTIWDDADAHTVPDQGAPDIDLPVSPESIGPSTQTQPVEPPPPASKSNAAAPAHTPSPDPVPDPSGDGGGGVCYPDDDNVSHKED
jgi:hypothetical protein